MSARLFLLYRDTSETRQLQFESVAAIFERGIRLEPSCELGSDAPSSSFPTLNRQKTLTAQPKSGCVEWMKTADFVHFALAF